MGKVLVTDDRTGEALTSIDSKRASSDGLLMVARHVLDGEELDDTFATVDAPEQRDAVRVFGTSCEIQGEFYGVEVVAGGLFERSAYMLSVDPVRSEEDGGATIAVFGPPGKSIPLRVLSADEWQQMKQSQDSSLDGADG